MRNYKEVKLSEKGELETEIKKDLKTEVIPFKVEETNDTAPLANESTLVDRMEKIVKNSKLKDEYDAMNSSLQNTIQVCNTSRKVFANAAVVFDKGYENLNEAKSALAAAAETMESVCDRCVEIICRIENFKYIVELDESSKNLLAGHRSEILEKETGLMNRHVAELKQILQGHHSWMENEINSSKGFWLSSKNGWILIGVLTICFFFTLMFFVNYIYLKISGGHIYI